MKTLFHYPLCGFSRCIRVFLKEKQIECDLVTEYPWDRKKKLSDYSVLSDIPLFIDKDNTVYEGWLAIIDHLDQNIRMEQIKKIEPCIMGNIYLLGASAKNKAEIQRLLVYFGTFFYADVTKNIVYEKIVRKYIDGSSPDSHNIRNGVKFIETYMKYITWLIERRNWLAGDEFSLADIMAASQISVIDYMASIEWEKYPIVKDWYVRIKSRPSFRDILYDRLVIFSPPAHYSALDF